MSTPPTFAILQRDDTRLMLQVAPESHIIVPNWKVVRSMWNVYIWVRGVEQLYEQCQAAGATIDYELCTKPYGCREFGVRDPNGYDIGFGEML